MKRNGWKNRVAFPELLVTVFFVAGLLAASLPALAEPAPRAFHWVDFHSAQDAPVVEWVTNTLKVEKWTALREIGVEWDAALVVTTDRPGPQSSPESDSFTVWSVSLTSHQAQPLVTGVRPRLLQWIQFGVATDSELGLVYDSCRECDVSTYFTAFYYNPAEHAWRARWMHGNDGAQLGTASQAASGEPGGITTSVVYGLMTDLRGTSKLVTWTHLDFGGAKPAQDYVNEYTVDAATGMDGTEALGEEHAGPMKLALCQMDGAHAMLANGQDSALCRAAPEPKKKQAHERRPVTTPPANNEGRSMVARPPSARAKSAQTDKIPPATKPGMPKQ